MASYQHYAGKRSVALPASYHKPRVCIGYRTVDGPVPCTNSLEGAPGHKKRCTSCYNEHDRHRRAVRKMQRKDPSRDVRHCLGYIQDGKVVTCQAELGHALKKRCADCANKHKLWRDNEYHKGRTRDRRSPRKVKANRMPPSVHGRTPIPLCETCGNLPWRREAMCEECGLPWAEETIERGEVLHSSASGEFSRNYSR